MKKAQFFVYIAFGLIMLFVAIDYTSTFSELGMTFLPIIIAFAVCLLWGIVSFISIWWALTAIPSMRESYPKLTQKLPKYFNNYLLPIIILVFLICAGQINSYVVKQQGLNIGFTENDDFKKAKEKNIFDKDKWIVYKTEQAKVQQIANEKKEKEVQEQKSKNYIESKISSLDKNSGEYIVAQNIYKKYGVWSDDFIAMQKRVCVREYNRLLAANAASEQAVENWNQVSDSLRKSGYSTSAGGRMASTDPGIQQTSSDIHYAVTQLNECGAAHLDEIENRVTVQD